MTVDDQIPNPSPGELAILRVLWDTPGLTVRDIHDSLRQKSTGYTTVLKMLQIMLDKGLVTREPEGRAHRYYAAVQEQSVKVSLVADLVDRAFGGAAQKLVLHALQSKRPSAQELKEIRDMLDAFEDPTK